jgi:hypothetical protein
MSLAERAVQESEEVDAESARPRSKSVDVSNENGSPPSRRLSRLQLYAEQMKITKLSSEPLMEQTAIRSPLSPTRQPLSPRLRVRQNLD